MVAIGCEPGNAREDLDTATKAIPEGQARANRVLRGWLVHRHRVGGRGECRFPVPHIYDRLGFINLARVLVNSRMP